ncbi:hypothetical protein ABIA32_000700 [Streptacidiphilus sp. MAP12-20]|uniref:hypothetical protein n=1 Tax=Streptacidiphilus sp. MAP12-20 TaxID=3156299 RepID=UPI00351555F5
MSDLPTAPVAPMAPPAPGAPDESEVFAFGAAAEPVRYGPADSEVWAGRGLGAVLALAGADPVRLAETTSARGFIAWVLFFCVLLAVSWFAAPPVVARPVTGDVLWRSRLSRHRNSALAVGFVVAAALTSPPVWLMACDAALLLTYLLFVDAAAAGPPGAAQLRDWPAVVGALAAQGLVLTGAVVSIATADSWARALAAVLVLVVAAALGLAVWRKPSGRR